MSQSDSPTTPPPNWPRPKALLLDAMGTLIGLRDSVGTTYAARAGAHGLDVEARAIDAVFPTVLRKAPPLAFAGRSDPSLLEAERSWWGARIDEAFLAAGARRAPEALHHELFAYFATPEPWYVYPDVPEHLGRWREQGIRLAVVSNFDRRLHRLLEALDLAGSLEVVVVSSAAGAAKPSPQPFRQALAALELDASQAWHVGDAPEDLAGARAAGIRCVTVRRP